MHLDGASSWRQRRCPQPVNEAQYLCEQGPCDGDLCELEGDIAAVANDLAADLHQLLVGRRQGLVVNLFGQREFPRSGFVLWL